MKKDKRPLGGNEKVFWLLDQISQVHFTMAAEIDGIASRDAWRAAIDAVQQRHPLFSAFIRANGYLNPEFILDQQAEIPFKLIQAEDNYHWEEEMEKQLSQPFDWSRPPLLRTVVIEQGNKSVLVIAAHHSISDGMSMTYVIRDILNSLNGKILEKMSVPVSADERLGLLPASEEETTEREISEDADLFERRDEIRPEIERIQFDEDLSAKLVNMARKEGTTVHGALCAATVIAGRKLNSFWKENQVRVINPISTRKLLGIEEESGLYISAKTVSVTADNEDSFWELARFAKSEIHGVNDAGTQKAVGEQLHQWIFGTSSIIDISDALQSNVSREVMLSNLGVLPIESEYGTMKLRAIWGPLALSGFKGDQTIGITGLNGTIQLMHVSRIPMKGLLKAIFAEISCACA